MVAPFALSTVADHLGSVVREAEEALLVEQAVHGLDVLDEGGLQALLAAGLRRFYEVAREVSYPQSSASADTRRAGRLRCDLVLSPLGQPLARDGAQLSLLDTRVTCPPEEALWLEVKVAYEMRAGGERHRGYGTQWRHALYRDLRKMAAAPLRQAALVLVVFNESLEILHKDLDLVESVLAAQGGLAGFRQVRTLPILNRIGHSLCSIVIWPVMP